MKNIILVFLCICLSCTDIGNSEKEYSYTIKNESGVVINIYVSKDVDFREIDSRYTLELGNGDSYTKNHKDNAPFSNALYFENFFGSDNGELIFIKVVYNVEKYKVFNNHDDLKNDRNIFSSKYNVANLEEQFTFTKQDYLDAENCNGDCE